jgi:phosphatidylglycerol lysyltransferase
VSKHIPAGQRGPTDFPIPFRGASSAGTSQSVGAHAHDALARHAHDAADEVPIGAPDDVSVGEPHLRLRALRHAAGPLIALGLLALAAWLLRDATQSYRYEDIRHGVAIIPRTQLFAALALTILSYVVLTGYDSLALRWIGRDLPYGRRALASFLGYAFSHNVGLSWLGGAAPRYRLYTAWGLSAFEIARLLIFTSLTLWPGAMLIAAASLLAAPGFFATSLHLPYALCRPLAVVLLALVGAYLVATAVRRRPIRIRDWEMTLPPVSMAFMQVMLSALDWMVASAVLFVLLPVPQPLSYPYFVGLYVIATLAGVISNVPGGLGVFETIVFLALGGRAAGSGVVASLLVYRAVYFLLPLGIATTALVATEIAQRRAYFRTVTDVLGRWVPEIAPRLLALVVFVGGTVLLLSGATPALKHRISMVAGFVPLFLMELSHFLGSLSGVGLLMLAVGLQRRLDAAYHLAVLLLGCGIVFSLLKGFNYEEALVLAAILAVLVPCRPYFDRRASLIAQRFTLQWSIAVGVVIAASICLGFFAYRHVEYRNELWWHFELFGHASRFLRASVGTMIAMLIISTSRLLRPAPPEPMHLGPESMDTVHDIIARDPRAAANLGLLPDKTFLFSIDRRAMIMYAVYGRSWVAMGDPVGPRDQHAELVWRFCELCDYYDAWPIFYEAAADRLPLYLDAGLAPLKLGEVARVALPDFSLEGHARKEQRYIVRRLERDGASMELLPRERTPEVMEELRAVSDQWLERKNTREKGFSLGFFDPRYVSRFPVALVRKQGKIVAFANLWCGAEHEEVSVDLMRFSEGAPPSVMEYLFLKLILWGREQGYRWFNLGMAPFSGLEAHHLAPFWSRLGALAYRYGEHFYNFQGLRQFKEKFDPTWEPRYLVCPTGLALPRILANVAALVSGGLTGVMTK